MSEAEDNPQGQGGGLSAVRQAMAEAQPVVIQPPAPGPDEPPPHDGPPDGPGDPEPRQRLPDDCPVVPLGINGEYCFYLDASNQLRAVKHKDHSRLGVQSLFGSRIDLLYELWPRKDKDGNIVGWRPEKVAERLMAAAADRGVWDVMGRTRGRGAWRSDEGRLVFHVGDALIKSLPPGEVVVSGTRPGLVPPGPDGRYVYPAAAAQPRPGDLPAPAGQGGPGERLLEILATWNWKRGDLDAQLLLGWIAAAIVGGALHWRPLAWITGDMATGKSSLHKLIADVLGDGLVSVADATPAGIWQKLGHASLPVAIDELEADEDNRRANKVIELARLAASGALMLRGGADHVGSEFVARSCFLFSSILIPPLLPQDKSRMAVLDLKPFAKEATPPKLEAGELGQVGRQLRRRLLDQWPRFDATLESYRQQLAASAGATSRASDVYGTLLACADLVLFDAPPDGDTLAGWAAKIAALGLDENQAEGANHARLIEYLRTTVLDVYRNGTKTSVGQLLLAAAGKADQGDFQGDGEAQRILGTFGIRWVLNPLDHKHPGEYVAFANSHQGLAQLLHGTMWGKRAGSTGGWVQALGRIEGAAHGNLRFAGVASRCVLVPFAQVVPEEEGEGV